MFSYGNSRLAFFRNFHYKSDSIVIAAAARTPWGKYQGQLSSQNSWQLGQLAVEAAVKRSAIPIECIEEIFMNEYPAIQKSQEHEFTFSNLLRRVKYTPIYVEDSDEPKIEAVIKALEFIKCQPQKVVVVGGLEFGTQKKAVSNQKFEKRKSYFCDVSSNFSLEEYKSKSALRYLISQNEAVFDSEIVPLRIVQQISERRIIREVTQDEICTENCEDKHNIPCYYTDGAASLVLTTFANAQSLKISPLVIIIDFEYLHNSSNIFHNSRDCVEKFFSKNELDFHDIKHWEVEDSIPQLVTFLKHHFKLDFDLINPHGGSIVFGHSSASSLTRRLTHLSHSLNSNEYGCVICSNSRESLVLAIQKLPVPIICKSLPVVTLYTKDPCPLCEILIDELETHFFGEYKLEKVFIDTKDNLRFLRLYRYDIPVVFLNNQFLCMHRLNHRLLRKRLDKLKKN